MLRYITILLFIGITTLLSGQSPNTQRLTDSLFQNWQNEKNTIENRRDNFHDYIWKAILFVNPDSAEVLARQLVDFCDKNDNLHGKSKGLNTLAVSYAIRSNYEKAIETFQQNVIIYQQIENAFRLGKAYNNIGNCYHEQDLFYQSLDYFNKALLVFDGMLDTCNQETEESVRLRMEQTYTAVISTYIGLNELDKAREIYQKNITNIDKINTEIDASFLYQQSANLELKSGNPEKVLEEVNKGIKEAKRFNNKPILGLCLRIKSEVYIDKNNLDSAILLLKEADLLFQEIRNSRSEVAIKLLLIDALIKKNRLKEALKYLKITADLSKDNSLDFAKSTVYNLYSDYYSKIGNTDKAYFYLKKHYALEDSINQQQNDKLLTSLEDKYAYESELSNQVLKIELEKATAKKTRIILILVGLLAIILAVLTWHFFNLNKQLKNQKSELIEQKMALNESLSKLEESNQNLQQFAGAAAHDLKGPLRTISSFTNLINRKYRKLVQPEDTKYFDFILRGTTTMHELITGLLQYSSMSNKVMKVEPVDLNNVLQEVILSLNTNIQEAKATINIQNNLPVCNGQPTLLFQVFSNLINNAIKFRKEIAPLTIDINYKLQNNDYQLITIKDNGIGIEEKYQDDVFKVFTKLHNATEYEGVGLGLSLSKKIIERFDGEIWLESEFGIGTTLFVKLKKG